MRRARILLSSVLGLSLSVVTGAPAGALAGQSRPQAVARVQAAIPAIAPAAGPLSVPQAAHVGQASTTPAKSDGKPVRVRELGSKRSESSKSYEMSDGTTQVELSTQPMHFRDGNGKWQDIDTGVVAGSGEDAFENAKNGFRTRFGKSSDHLVSFEVDGRSIGLGLAGDKRKLTPAADGSTVTFPDVFGTADVRYHVSPTGLKEDIVLAGTTDAASEFSFELRTSGLVAKPQADGSIWFVKHNDDTQPAYVMPAPFMYDASSHNRLGEAGYSEKVTQTVTQRGGTSIVTIKPDATWLNSASRTFPVVIDPTITVVPAPSAAQDTMLSEVNPSGNYGTYSNMNVGSDTGQNTYRALLKFDTSMIPTGTTIRSADLNLHFSSPFSSETNVIPFVAQQATKDWTETTATWTSMSASYSATSLYNQIIVDDQDTLSTS